LLLVAAASTFMAPWVDPPGKRGAFAGILAVLVVGGIALVPIAVPLLPPAELSRYAAALGVTQATRTNYGGTLPLPQDFADMTGWREQAETVASVYHALPPNEQSSAAIVATNYGRAGALALHGRSLGLPYPVSRNGDFYFWGAGEKGRTLIVVVGGTLEQVRPLCEETTEAARSRNPWGVDEERDVPIFICRRPRLDLSELFRRMGPEWG
jgi:hypothetical protein